MSAIYHVSHVSSQTHQQFYSNDAEARDANVRFNGFRDRQRIPEGKQANKYDSTGASY